MILTGSVKRSGALLGAGTVLGLILVVYGVEHLASPRLRPVGAPPKPLPVVVATRPIAHGERIGVGDVTLADVGAAPPQALTMTAAAVGQVAVADISARQAVTPSLLAADFNLADQVPVGYRAISVATTDETAVSGLLRPGDVVDVELVLGDPLLSKGSAGAAPDQSESSTLLQSVRILSVGEMVGRGASSGRRQDQAVPRRTLTLAMTPDQVARFALARSLGAYFLVLRNPADKDQPPRAFAHLTDIRASTPAPTPRKAQARTAHGPAGARVELVVGGKSQTLYAR